MKVAVKFLFYFMLWSERAMNPAVIQEYISIVSSKVALVLLRLVSCICNIKEFFQTLLLGIIWLSSNLKWNKTYPTYLVHYLKKFNLFYEKMYAIWIKMKGLVKRIKEQVLGNIQNSFVAI